MSGYEKCESIGRKAVIDLFGKYYNFSFTEDPYNRVDFYATGHTLNMPEYVGDVKYYVLERSFHKFSNYMIDYEKLKEIVDRATKEGRVPILICFFTDYTVVWNLKDIPFKSRAEWRWVNKDGQNYGTEKEWSYMTYLYENEAVWIKKTKVPS